MIEIKKQANRGRPKQGALPTVLHYQVKGKVIEDIQAIEARRRQKGRFILATNECDREKLPDETLLATYKAQSKTERGFKFIKADAF